MCIDDGKIVSGLVFKDADLGREIVGLRRIAIQVVRGKVQPQTDVRAEGRNRFQLEAADLQRQLIQRLAAENDFAQGHAVIAARHGALATGVQHGAQQFRGGALAVRASDGDHRHVREREAELHLTRQRHPDIAEFLRQRPAHIQPRAQDRQLIFSWRNDHRFRFITGYHMQAIGLGSVDVLRQLSRITFVKQRDARAMPGSQTRRCETAARGPENGDVLSRKAVHVQRSLSVASPSKARMRDRIQKRVMTWFSTQPPSSK